MKFGKLLSFAIGCVISLGLTSCGTDSSSQTNSSSGGGGEQTEVKFNYSNVSYTPTYGTRTNEESHDYDSIKVQPTDKALRDDFAMGVDGSMIAQIEENGGVYYNQNGQEQDVFQILRESGVNFFRVRLWNNPQSRLKRLYGGGNNNLNTDIQLCRRAKAVGMNVLVDFHYSDFWADPDKQWRPKDWRTYSQEQVNTAIKEFTAESLQAFKDADVTVDAVQIGNETNNGMCGFDIDWGDTDSSFDTIAAMMKAGIEGAKSVFPSTYTMIHLANGGNTAEFETYFKAMDERGVNYDIIGASFYPYMSGKLESLAENLNNIAKVTGKPVIVAETSWGFTDEANDNASNTYYGENYEDVGGYLTSEQAQATSLRDIVNVLANVDDNKGLGVFYWEPGWLPVSGSAWATAAGQSYCDYGNDDHRSEYTDGKATWSNQGLFSYTGKALASINTFKYLSTREGFNATEETVVSQRENNLDVEINVAASEELPETGSVVTNYDAIRQAEIVWDQESIEKSKQVGEYTANGTLAGQYPITANVKCIQNFVVDPGFENQGSTDVVKDPWKLNNVTPIGKKVAKLDRKTDTRSGTTDFNWYWATEDFTFQIYQEIELEPGTYHLNTYIMAVEQTTYAHTQLDVFIEYGNSKVIADMKNVIAGWNAGYKATDLVVGEDGNPVLGNIVISEKMTVKIGLEGSAAACAWGHNDDWTLVKIA